MKKLFVLAAAAATLAVASTPSRADAVDMSTITCENLMSMKQDEVSFVLIWVQGYMAGTNDDSTMDPEVLTKSVNDTVTYCQANKSTSVVNAVKATAEE
jgi:hypothetical protein